MDPKRNRKYQKTFRQNLRKGATIYERILWSKLRGRQLNGRKFRRQAGFGKYVADFYCPAEKLVVELDGFYHQFEHVSEMDKERDEYFENLGITVLRISNPQNSRELTKVLNVIAAHFKSS